MPRFFVTEDGVQYAEQFSHAGDESDFLLLSKVLKMVVVFFDDGVVLSGDEGGHVESGSNSGPSSPRGASTAPSSAVAVDGCDADEGGDLLPGAGAEFGQFRQEGECGLWSDAWHAAQQVVLLSPSGGFFNGVLQPLIDFFELLLQRIANCLDRLANELVGRLLEPILLHGEHSHELSPPGDLLLQIKLFSARQGSLLRLDRQQVVADHHTYLATLGVACLAAGIGLVQCLLRPMHAGT